ncbi:MAG TPA: response regulator [Syntrophales bacterium]|nr:response regulator [Syntrophales bacterium]
MHIGFSTLGLGIFGLLAGVVFYGPEFPAGYTSKLILLGFCILLIGFGLSYSQLAFLYRKVRNAEKEMHEAMLERNEALELANRNLDQANRAKSAFLANMSHELRTPLNAVIGFSEVLEDQTFGPLNAKQMKYVLNVRNSGKHLLNMINDILDLSKIEAGRLDLLLEKFPLRETVDGIIGIVRVLANKKNILLNYEIDPALKEIEADAKHFKQVLYNLLSNAVKFTQEGGTVNLGAVLSQGAGQAGTNLVQISVSDTGIGIAPEDYGKVFSEFQQIDDSYSRQQEGTGLGLALSKRLVELNGGEMWFSSEKGKGSTFTFTIPLVHSPDRAAEEIVTSAGSVEDGREDGASGKELVLVIEDEPRSAELISIYLAQAGYRVAFAADGEEGLRLAIELRPSAITLDIMLPKMDGWQVLNALKENPITREIPVIVSSMVDEKIMAYDLGAVDYVLKPLNRQELIVKLETLKSSGKLRPSASRVLVIDDHLKTLDLIYAFLEHHGYEVSVTSSGAEALELMKANHYDALILDLMMPGMSGFEVLDEMKHHPWGENIPVIVYTAKDVGSEEQAQLSKNISALVSKGHSSNDLLDALSRLTRSVEKKETVSGCG